MTGVPIVVGLRFIGEASGQAEPPMMAFDSQGIALILIVAVLSLVVGGAALWIELP